MLPVSETPKAPTADVVLKPEALASSLLGLTLGETEAEAIEVVPPATSELSSTPLVIDQGADAPAGMLAAARKEECLGKWDWGDTTPLPELGSPRLSGIGSSMLADELRLAKAIELIHRKGLTIANVRMYTKPLPLADFSGFCRFAHFYHPAHVQAHA